MSSPFFRAPASMTSSTSPSFSALVPGPQPMFSQPASDEVFFPSLEQMAALNVRSGSSSGKPTGFWDLPSPSKAPRSSSMATIGSPLRMVTYPKASPHTVARAEHAERVASPMEESSDEQLVPDSSPTPVESTSPQSRRPTPYPYLPVPATMDTTFPADSLLRGGSLPAPNAASRSSRMLFPIVEMDEDV
eukprot:m.20419 g.20419  ORF g.20419 m.20419 type:complete len:190 (+) comp7832_c0_seq1:67-636(+)